CKSREIESACRRPSCVYPSICPNLDTDHAPLIRLYRRARALPGIRRVLIASGERYDQALESPEYVKELAQHHTGGYLKIAPEAIAEGPLSKMMKPGVGAYHRFKELFGRDSQQAGKEQYLIPYFLAAPPGTSELDMLELALWLKRNGFRADQVQAFLPGPMATATAMYHSGKNPLKRITRTSEEVLIPKGLKIRRLHKAFLRYHDPNNWPLLREALRRMGRADLIGNGRHQLIPAYQPAGTGGRALTGQGRRPRPRHGSAPRDPWPDRPCDFALRGARPRGRAPRRQPPGGARARHPRRPRQRHARHHPGDPRLAGPGGELRQPPGRACGERRNLHPLCEPCGGDGAGDQPRGRDSGLDRKSTRLNSSHVSSSYA